MCFQQENLQYAQIQGQIQGVSGALDSLQKFLVYQDRDTLIEQSL